MSTTTNQKFKITVPITRCYLRKSADGTQKYVIEGMASNADLDLTGERMAESAILSMAKSVQTHPVLFKSEHLDDWDAEFGEVTALSATPNYQLMMEAELDPDHYRTKTLVKALEKGKKLGLSVGGYVIESSYEWLSDLGRKVKTYTDIALEEISVTSNPAVANTWLTNITKSVTDWKDPSMKIMQTLDSPELRKTEAPVEQPGTPPVVEQTTAEVDPSAVNKAAKWTVGAADKLPVANDSWDAATAQDSVFTWAGWPDKPDASKAQQAFLVFDAANPSAKGSYKLPFARVTNGKLEAVTGGLHAAASRLPQTSLPKATADAARKVLDAYYFANNDARDALAAYYRDSQAQTAKSNENNEEPTVTKAIDTEAGEPQVSPETVPEQLTPAEVNVPENPATETPTEPQVEPDHAAGNEEEAIQPHNQPVEPQAPAQEDETAKPDAEAVPSTPASAEGDTSEGEATQKSLTAATARVEHLTKSLAERDSKVTELTKVNEAKTQELETAQKSLSDKATELDSVQKSLTELTATYEQATKDLESAQKTLEIQKGRKTLAFNGGVTKAVLVDLEKSGIKATTELPKKLNGVY